MKRRIAFFIGTLSNGGAERAVSNLSMNLSDEFDKNIILYGDQAKVKYPYTGNVLMLDRIEPSSLIKKIYAFFYRIIKLRKIKKANNMNTIVSFLEYPNLVNLLSGKYGKTIISVRNHMSTKHKGLKGYIWNLSMKLFYNKADIIVSVSQEIKKDLINNYGIKENKIEVIYNSYPIDEIKLLADENISCDYKTVFEQPVIITAGRLHDQKGHWHLIRAFKEVKREITNAKLVILGNGKLESYLKDLARSLNIDGDVHFLGFQENPFKYISRSKIFVLSSLYEGFPNSLVEAMVCGVPIISTDCPSGPREILAPTKIKANNYHYKINKDNYGILVPICDGKKYGADDKLTYEERILADRMCCLMKSDKLLDYYKRKSIERSNDFSIDKIIGKWQDIIK